MCECAVGQLHDAVWSEFRFLGYACTSRVGCDGYWWVLECESAVPHWRDDSWVAARTYAYTKRKQTQELGTVVPLRAVLLGLERRFLPRVTGILGHSAVWLGRSPHIGSWTTWCGS